MQDTASIIKLASEASKFFVTKRRDKGDQYVSAPDAPEWLKDIIRDAHGTMLPDDYRYGMIHGALSAISDADEDTDLSDMAHDFADCEPSVYNTERSAWLASHLERAGYVDDAVKDFGMDAQAFDIYQAIAMGWYAEAQEVFGLVLSGLEEIAQNQQDDEEASQDRESYSDDQDRKSYT